MQEESACGVCQQASNGNILDVQHLDRKTETSTAIPAKRACALTECLARPAHLLELGDTPLVLVLCVSIEQRLDPLVSLALRDTRCISDLEELRRDFCKPFGFDCSDVPAVLSSCQEQFVVDDPFWCSVEDGRGGWLRKVRQSSDFQGYKMYRADLRCKNTGVPSTSVL